MNKKPASLIRGGVARSSDGKYCMVVSVWIGSVAASGLNPPTETFVSSETFDTFEEAEHFYLTHGRARLRSIHEKLTQQLPVGASITHYEGDPVDTKLTPVTEFEPVETKHGVITLDEVTPDALRMKFQLPNGAHMAPVEERTAFITSDRKIAAIAFVDSIDHEMNAVYFMRNTERDPWRCVHLMVSIDYDDFRTAVVQQITDYVSGRRSGE